MRVMNAKTGSTDDLEKEGYIFEPKLDGYRALCFVNKKLTFISRNEKDITHNYPELDVRPQIKALSAILDGEIVAYDAQGNPSFALLQKSYSASYVVFDILMKDGVSLIDLPLIERKKILAQTVVDGQRCEKIFFTKNGPALWHEMKKRNFEGVMAKKENSAYYPGLRSGVWLKIKLLSTIDSVIIGYLAGKRAISSLALGLYDTQKQLRYIGNVGTGFKESTLQELLPKLKALSTVPYTIKNSQYLPKDILWVKPKLVGQIRYLEITPQAIVRASVFLRLRDDKKPGECTIQDQLPYFPDK